MVVGAVLSIECRLLKDVELGDHVMMVGEVIDVSLNKGKEPLAYYKVKYWKIGDNIPKPQQEELERIKAIVEKHAK